VTLSAASAVAVALDNITIGLFHSDGTSIISKFYSLATTPEIYTGGGGQYCRYLDGFKRAAGEWRLLPATHRRFG
jgi:hypothetical protein